MKNYKRIPHAVLLFAAVTVWSCQTNDADNIGKTEHEISFNAVCSSTSRAYFGDRTDGSYPTLWSGDESVAISLNGAEAVIATVENVSADHTTASLKGTFVDDRSGSYRFHAFAPSSRVSAVFDGDKPRVRVTIPVNQTPSAASCDQAAMLIYSMSDAFETIPATVNLPKFNHATAYGCLTIEDIPTAENIDKVIVTADCNIAGAAWFYFETAGSIAAGTWQDCYDAAGGSAKQIVIDTNARSNIMFACRPTTGLAQLKIDIVTDKGEYSKTIELTGKDFVAGKVALMTVGGFAAAAPEAVIHTIDDMNRVAHKANTHADDWQNSVLEYRFNTYCRLSNSASPLSGHAEIGMYPRIRRLSNGKYLLTYQQNYHAYNIYYALSDDMKTWVDKGGLATQKKANGKYKSIDIKVLDETTGLLKDSTCIPRYTTCDFAELADGSILAVITRWPKSGYEICSENTAIVAMRSTDKGQTWSSEEVIWRGWNWEPSVMQLASGEIHVYFTRSNPITDDSGTALLRSTDNGKTWIDAGFVARQKSKYPAVDGSGKAVYTDQMAVVVELNDNKGMAMAMESRIGSTPTNPEEVYHISMAYSHDNWATPVMVDYNQNTALHTSNFIQNSGSPYIVQFPSGETVLSCNTDGIYSVRLGDSNAEFRGVARQTPFGNMTGCWGALALDNSHTLIATFPYVFNASNKNCGDILVTKMVLNHRIDATAFTPVINGGNDEWNAVDEALFLGSETSTETIFRFAYDAANVYLLIERSDTNVADADKSVVWLQNGNGTGTPLKLTFTPEPASEQVTCDNAAVECRSTLRANEGYVVEARIPRTQFAGTNSKLLFNAVAYEGATTDTFFGLTATNYSSWLPIVLEPATPSGNTIAAVPYDTWTVQ